MSLSCSHMRTCCQAPVAWAPLPQNQSSPHTLTRPGWYTYVSRPPRVASEHIWRHWTRALKEPLSSVVHPDGHAALQMHVRGGRRFRRSLGRPSGSAALWRLIKCSHVCVMLHLQVNGVTSAGSMGAREGGTLELCERVQRCNGAVGAAILLANDPIRWKGPGAEYNLSLQKPGGTQGPQIAHLHHRGPAACHRA